MTDNKTSNDLDSVNRENTVQRRKLSYIRSIESEEEIGKQVFQNLPDELKTASSITPKVRYHKKR